MRVWKWVIAYVGIWFLICWGVAAFAETLTCTKSDTSRGFTLSCESHSTPQPQPQPVPQPTPQPLPPPQSCGGSYELRSLGQAQASVFFTGHGGTVYAFPIPKVGAEYHGYFTLADTPGTPQELQVELSISRCPGDMSRNYSPCGGKFGPSANLNWTPSASFYQCGTPEPGPYYLNMRFVQNCRTETATGVSDPSNCRVVFTHNEF